MAKKNELIANSKILSLLDKESKLNFSDNKVKLENSKILSISQEPDPIPSDNNNNTYNYYNFLSGNVPFRLAKSGTADLLWFGNPGMYFSGELM